MQIIVRDNPLRPPLFRSSDASWLEIRDDQGFLVVLVIFPPGKIDTMVIDRKDPEFETVVRNFNVKLCEGSAAQGNEGTKGPGGTNDNNVERRGEGSDSSLSGRR